MCRSLLTSEMTSLRARFLDAYKGMEVRSTKRLALAQADQLAAIAAPLVNRYRIEGETGR